MSLHRKIRVIKLLLKDAFREFRKNDPLRFGSSTAFFTTFALPPILILLINFLGILYNADLIGTKLIEKLETIFGNKGALQLQTILKNIQDINTSWYVAMLGLLFLIFVATTLFIVVQSSLNQLWGIRTKKITNNFRHMLQTRTISLGIIIATAILFMISLVADSMLAYIGDSLRDLLPGPRVALIRLGNALASLVIVTIWFAITFKFLPDIRIKWRPVWVGAIFTAILFTIGKFILGRLLIISNLGPIYGSSASILLIMLFVFYASMILFYGAAFTKVYANYAAFRYRPHWYAIRYRIKQKRRPLMPFSPSQQ